MDHHCAIRSLRFCGLLVLGLAACSNAENLPNSMFSGPSGLAVAGTDHSRVFVANSGFDAVQVVNLNQQLPNIDMAMAPARYFPLFIPTGPNPTDLAASPDGAYVFVLDTLLGAVRMIDATTLKLVPLANAIDDFDVALAPIDGLFDTMVASPGACSADGVPGGRCVGRIYLGSQGFGQIAVADAVLAADATMSLHNRGWLSAAGVPGRIAVVPIADGAGGSSAGDRLFVTDLASARVNQIDYVQGASTLVAQIDVGERAGALGVSADGNYLVVGRPTLQDVVVYPLTEAGAGASPLDLAPVFTPIPQCVAPCDNPSACSDAHPADRELCTNNNTINFASQPSPQIYPAAYLGGMPTQIAPVASAAQPVQVDCQTAGAPSSYNEAMAIATFDGSIYFLGLVDGNGAFNPRLLTQDKCNPPTIKPVMLAKPDEDPLADYLAPCPALAQKRGRAVCVDGNGINDAGRVTLMPGNLRLQGLGSLSTPQSIQVRLDWEGIVFDGASMGYQGAIDAQDGNVFNLGGANVAGTVQSGDKLRLATTVVSPKLNAACQQALEASGNPCLLERSIESVSLDGGRLVLTSSLPRVCFADADALSYVVRAGDAFLAGAVTNSAWQNKPVGRVKPGEAFGMGSAQGGTMLSYATFTLNQFTLDGNAKTNGCAVYGDNGELKSTTQTPYLKRDTPFDFIINDPYTPAQWGRSADPTQSTTTAAGRTPASMVMAPAPFSTLLVSYNGSGSVYVMRPTRPTDATLISNLNYVRILN